MPKRPHPSLANGLLPGSAKAIHEIILIVIRVISWIVLLPSTLVDCVFINPIKALDGMGLPLLEHLHP